MKRKVISSFINEVEECIYKPQQYTTIYISHNQEQVTEQMHSCKQGEIDESEGEPKMMIHPYPN